MFVRVKAARSACRFRFHRVALDDAHLFSGANTRFWRRPRKSLRPTRTKGIVAAWLRRRYTTAEIVVQEPEWDPLPSVTARRERVPVRIAIQETTLREKVKTAGGRWDPDKRVWMFPMEQVIQLGLTGR